MATTRVRIVCISDTHNQTPKLPAGDILIHAGDLTNQGTFSELQKAVSWLRQAKFQVKIVVCGNHDITCDIPFYRQHGAHFHNKKMEDPQRCIALFRSDPSIVYLQHESKQVRIIHKDDSFSNLKVFGSPFSPANGLWAFGYAPEHASHLWNQIPLDTEIVVTHTPAQFHRAESGSHRAAGCEGLRETLWRVRPRLFVCGHVHEAYGVEAVTWHPHAKLKDRGVRYWRDADPESKKQFTIDLSSRAKSLALQNDGSTKMVSTFPVAKSESATGDGAAANDIVLEAERKKRVSSAMPALRPPLPDSEKVERPITSTEGGTKLRQPVHHGHEDIASVGRPEQEAIYGSRGRLETCVVNAAFMASNWPHKDGKKFHKPIVIDLDLPVLYPDQTPGLSDSSVNVSPESPQAHTTRR